MPATVESRISAVGERSEGRSGKPIKSPNRAGVTVETLARWIEFYRQQNNKARRGYYTFPA